MKKLFTRVSLLLLLLTHSLCAQYSLVGNTTLISPGTYQLTANIGGQVGSIWNTTKINLNESFDFNFELYFGVNDANGADGITFTLQPVSTSIGVAGNGMGILGVTPALTVEFDTYLNPGIDPTYDHIAIEKNGDVDHTTANRLAGPIGATPLNTNIEDGKYHKARIIWDAKYHKMRVYFDCVLRLTYNGDIVNSIFGGDPMVYWGCTAATGGWFNEQNVRNFKIDVNKLKDETICLGDSLQLSSRAGDSYTWTPATNISATNIANPKVFPKTNTQYIVKVTDACINTWYDTTNISVINPAGGFLGSDKTICTGDPTVLLDATKPGATYLWNDNSTAATLSPIASGIYSVKVSLAGACSTSDTINVTINPKPTVALGAAQIICAGKSATFNAGNPGASFAWTGPNGYTASTSSITTSIAGTYNVKVTNSFSCFTNASTVLTVNPLPIISLSNQSTCNGGSASFDAGNTGAIFSWTGPSGYTNTANPISVATAGTYTVSVTDANSCSQTASATLSINSSNSVDLGKNALFCDAVSMVLDAQNPGATYLWNDNSTNQTLAVNAAGTYSVTVKQNGCSSTGSITISQYSKPIASISGDSTICQGSSSNLDVNSSKTIKTLFWSNKKSTQSIKVSTAGNYNVEITDTDGCVARDTFAVQQHPLPSIFLDSDTSFCFMNEKKLTLTLHNTTDSLRWSNGIKQNQIDIYSEGIYSVTATNQYLCSTTKTIAVEQDCLNLLFIPNTFTPNGDGRNDVFKVVSENISDYELQIFNRWGEMIFDSRNVDEHWDGTLKSISCQIDTYAYHLSYSTVSKGKKTKHQLIGSVNLLR
jgi:gliding motility-associated-like protein